MCITVQRDPKYYMIKLDTLHAISYELPSLILALSVVVVVFDCSLAADGDVSASSVILSCGAVCSLVVSSSLEVLTNTF